MLALPVVKVDHHSASLLTGLGTLHAEMKNQKKCVVSSFLHYYPRLFLSLLDRERAFWLSIYCSQQELSSFEQNLLPADMLLFL